VPTVLAELTRCQPAVASFVHDLRTSPDLTATMHAQFGQLPRISIDYALMEHAQRVINLEATFDWDDVGSWLSVAKYLPTDAAGNAVKGILSQLRSHDNIVYSNQPTDALLIADRNAADEIKKIVDQVPASLR
jgi:mannose-1-phosphate guanylyltransferase